MVEYSNRVYANAGLRFTFNPETSFERILDPDINCWGDLEGLMGSQTNPTDGELANAYARDHANSLVLIFHSYQRNTAGECIPQACDPHNQYCSGDYSNTICTGFLWGNYCGPGGYVSGIPLCFIGNTASQGQDRCTEKPCEMGDPSQSEAIIFRPIGTNAEIAKFAHEAGHHFGLRHTFDSAESRCYDRAFEDLKIEDDPNCREPEPGCSGPGLQLDPSANCGSNTQPWKNIMSYHGCSALYPGLWHGDPSDWNSSFSREQIQIIWRTLDEFWDPPMESSSDTREHGTGGYDTIFLAQTGSAATRSALGKESWGTLSFTSVGDSSWTKGNVRIIQGDTDGDGLQDAIVSASGGSHPGTSYYHGRRYWSYNLSTFGWHSTLDYVSTLDASAGPVASVVSVGNFMGDDSDDVLIQTASGASFWQGHKGANPTGAGTNSQWNTSIQLVLGNFANTWTTTSLFDSNGNPLNRLGDFDHTSHVSYDDVVILTSQGASVCYGSPSGISCPTSQSYFSKYTNQNAKVWAANVWGDYHDELIVHSPYGLEVIAGSDSFSFQNVLMTESGFSANAVVDLAIGNFSGDHYADFVTSMSGGQTALNGSRLWLGRETSTPWYSPQLSWVRTDLDPTTAVYQVGDLLRGGYDDLMISTSTGAFLYTGYSTSEYHGLVPNAWAQWDTAYGKDMAVWFGR